MIGIADAGGGGFVGVDRENAARLGLPGSAIDGICEAVVADEDRIVDEAFDGRRPCLGRRELGGGG